MKHYDINRPVQWRTGVLKKVQDPPVTGWCAGLVFIPLVESLVLWAWIIKVNGESK